MAPCAESRRPGSAQSPGTWVVEGSCTAVESVVVSWESLLLLGGRCVWMEPRRLVGELVRGRSGGVPEVVRIECIQGPLVVEGPVLL